MSVPFAAKNFYSKRETKLAVDIKIKLERTAKLMRSQPLPPELPSSLLGPSPDWRVFHRQEDALLAAKTLQLMTFSFEERVPESGGR